jgi:hypothetical protein
MKRLQPTIPPTVPSPHVAAPQVSFNSPTPQTFPSVIPPFFPSSGQRPLNTSVDFHSQQQEYIYVYRLNIRETKNKIKYSFNIDYDLETHCHPRTFMSV